MRVSLHESIAASLDAPPELLPYLPELLADLDALGSEPRELLALLAPLGLRASTRLLDLGCGKGAVARAAAAELGWEVTGVDGLAPFVEAARALAQQQGLATYRFAVGDIREAAARERGFDVVVLAGLGPVFGSPRETMGAVRGCVLAGGHVVIDDGFVDVPSAGQFDREATVRQLVSFGDLLVIERLGAPQESAAREARLAASIRARAEQLAQRYPELADLVRRYAAEQERLAASFGDGPRDATWVLRVAR